MLILCTSCDTEVNAEDFTCMPDLYAASRHWPPVKAEHSHVIYVSGQPASIEPEYRECL
jgi:hypothetical protein